MVELVSAFSLVTLSVFYYFNVYLGTTTQSCFIVDITHMKSSEGEVVPLVDQISTAKARGQVEKWLLELQDDMVKSIRKVIAESLEAYKEEPRTQWVLKWPGQAVLCVTQKYWTDSVTTALATGPKVIMRSIILLI